jgi:hypothetical protein
VAAIRPGPLRAGRGAMSGRFSRSGPELRRPKEGRREKRLPPPPPRKGGAHTEKIRNSHGRRPGPESTGATADHPSASGLARGARRARARGWHSRKVASARRRSGARARTPARPRVQAVVEPRCRLVGAWIVAGGGTSRGRAQGHRVEEGVVADRGRGARRPRRARRATPDDQDLSIRCEGRRRRTGRGDRSGRGARCSIPIEERIADYEPDFTA